MMATKIEFDEWKRGYTVKVEEKKEVVEKELNNQRKPIKYSKSYLENRCT